ncbi:MAG: transposase, partial [Longicatena sp.]
EKGIEKGIEIGSRKGKEEERLHIISKFIRQKFGSDETEWLSTMTQEQLEHIIDELFLCETLKELKSKE